MAIIDPRARSNISVSSGEDRRWHEVWKLVIDAEKVPPAERRDFVMSCAGHSFVSRQALAILEGSDTVAGDLSLTELQGEPRFTPQVGMKIGRYRIGTLLGSGATGAVYAGFDEELSRAVAIKFFASGGQANPGARALPLREARAASALNHPNIIMIHEVVETGDASAIVMELVSGETLRTLAGADSRLSDLLHWSGQLAGALSVAHANGLVHGDIKPENVMVRDDGYVKLLDFGLALAALPDSSNSRSCCLTGTPRYLSPEQCSGGAATPASDIFSFGVMLYELSCGHHPFKADGMLVLLREIISVEPPPPVSINRSLPRALNALILRMLSKRPQDRPAAIEVAQQIAGMRARVDRAQGVGSSRRLQMIAAAVVVLGAASLLLVYRPSGGGVDISRMNVRPMASQPGLETNPSISPDGLWVSCLYRPMPNDRPQFQVHSTQGGPPLRIDTGPLVVEETAAWSPDSRDLAFVGRDPAGKRSVYRVSRAGGSISWMADSVSERGFDFDWSPDGRWLALTERLAGQKINALYLVELSSGRRRRLLQPQLWISGPRFSPDGKWIAFHRLTSVTNSEICMLPSAGGPVHCATRHPWWLTGFAWNPDSNSLIAMSAQQSDRAEMWLFPRDGRSEPVRLAKFDFGRTGAVSMSRSKGTIAWVRDLSSASIWRMPAEGGGAPRLVVGSAANDTDPEWSSQGQIVFRSDRSGASEIWIARGDGSGQVQATRFRGPFVGDPHWSPDGRRIAFTAHPEGNADIFTITCGIDGAQPCGEPKQLTRASHTDANPTWSLDGRWIYFSSNRTGQFEIWRMPSEGGQPDQVTRNGGYVSRESADGKWLYYSKMDNASGFWRLPLPIVEGAPQEEVVIPDTPVKAAATWALGSDELYYYPSAQEGTVPFPAVRAVDLKTHRIRDLATGGKVLGRSLSLSPDRRWLLRTDRDRTSSVVMIAE